MSGPKENTCEGLTVSDIALARTSDLLDAALSRVGFRLLAVEIDLTAGRARVEVKRHDGYMLTLDVRNGAGSITRERQRETVVAVGRRGDRFLANRLLMEFLGRTRVVGARAALRCFADFIADNSTMTQIEARDAIRLLLTGAGSEDQ